MNTYYVVRYAAPEDGYPKRREFLTMKAAHLFAAGLDRSQLPAKIQVVKTVWEIK